MSKVYIHHLNTYLGEALVQEFPDSEVFGTLEHQAPPLQYEESKLLSAEAEGYLSSLLEFPVVVLDLHTSSFSLVSRVLKHFKSFAQNEHTLVLVSSVKVWGSTSPKVRQLTQEELEDDQEEGTTVDPYTEEEFIKRKAPENYKSWKELENLALNIDRNIPHLSVYVVCAGIQYGNGESVLNYHFRSAWLEDPQNLPFIGSGENHVPTIHVRDLAKVVKFITLTKPQKKYIFGIDGSPDQSQKALVESISKGMGTGKVQSVDYETVKTEDWAETLNLNIRLQPSEVLVPGEKEESEEEQDSENEETKKEPKIEIQWHCFEGIAKNILKLNEEFNQARGLSSLKVFLTGPPASGKSYFGQKLAKFYNVPWIHVSSVLNHVTGLENELAESIKSKLSELKDEMIQEAEENKQEDEEINPESFQPRVPEDLVAKAFRHVLSQNSCRNRGYVLDGWPINYETAKQVFMTSVEEEENEEEEPKLELDESLLPQSVVVLEGEDTQLIQRVKALPEETIQDTHYNLNDMKRRLTKYRNQNNNPAGLPSVQEFFTEQNIQVFSIDCFEDNYEVEESIKIYLERFGRPFNYQTHQEEAEGLRIQQKKAQEETEKLLKAENERKEDAIETQKREKMMSEVQEKLKVLHYSNKSLLLERSQPLKSYLSENLYEILADGIADVCRKLPQDPVDHLAAYLFENAYRVPNPDPSII